MSLALILIFSMAILGEDPIAINNEAIALLEQGKIEVAIKKLVKANNMAPDSELIRKNLAVAYSKKGAALSKKGDYVTAEHTLREACRLDPKNPIFCYFQAGYLYRLGKLGHAEIMADKGISLSPNKELKPHLFRLKGNILYFQDRLKEALQVFQERVKADPKDHESLRMKRKIEREIIIQKEYKQDITSDFKLLYGLNNSFLKDGGSLLYILQKEKSKVCSDLNYHPKNRTTIIIYDAKDFKAVTETESWVGGLFDKKIRIPISKNRIDTELIGQVIRHEYTHVIVHELAPSCPVWVNEGIACCMQFKPGQGRKRMLAQLKKGVKVLPFDELPESFVTTNDANKVQLYYSQSHSMVEFLIDHYSLSRLHLLLKRLKIDGDWKKAFRFAYNVDFSSLEQRWKESLNIKN